jgi:phage terminase large subunit GpA-like protein
MSQWAARYRVLSPEATANHGPWRNDVVPYLVDIMDAVSDRTTQEVTVVSPSQAAKTELILNTVGYFVHQEPSPILVVQPTVETGESFSKDRVAPMLRDTKVLAALIRPARSRDSNNTILSKAYPGGQLDITGANAPAGLAMRPKRVVLLDERDRHPRSAGTEGDVKAISRARTRSFQRRRKVVEVSSPTSLEESLIWPSYLEGTQEKWHVPCPNPACQHEQTLVFERLRWETDALGALIPGTVRYECSACGHAIPAKDQRAFIRAGRWIATAVPRVRFKRSFHIDGLVAAFALWEEVAAEFIAASGEPDLALRADRLRAFFNTTLGQLYREVHRETQQTALVARARRYDGLEGDAALRWHLPREVALLTAGVDIQHDRAEIIVRGWGIGETSWLVERVVLRGDTSQPDFWARLDDWRLTRTWVHEGGARLNVASMAVDAGDGTHQKTVTAYTSPRLGQYVFAVKGHGSPTAPFLPAKPTRVKGGRLYLIGVHAIMDRLYRRLGMDTPGPGYLHVNTYADEDYCTQLLSMRRRLDPRTRKYRWEATPNVRNEVADCETYAYAALLLGPVPVTSLARELAKVVARGLEERATLGASDAVLAPAKPSAPKKRTKKPNPYRGGGGRWV